MIKLNGLGHVGGCGCGSCSGCSVPSQLKGLGGPAPYPAPLTSTSVTHLSYGQFRQANPHSPVTQSPDSPWFKDLPDGLQPPPDFWRSASGGPSPGMDSRTQQQQAWEQGTQVKQSYTDVLAGNMDRVGATAAQARALDRAARETDPLARARALEDARAYGDEAARLAAGGVMRPGVPVKRTVQWEEATSGGYAEIQQREMERRGVKTYRPPGWRPDLETERLRNERLKREAALAEKLAKQKAEQAARRAEQERINRERQAALRARAEADRLRREQERRAREGAEKAARAAARAKAEREAAEREARARKVLDDAEARNTQVAIPGYSFRPTAPLRLPAPKGQQVHAPPATAQTALRLPVYTPSPAKQATQAQQYRAGTPSARATVYNLMGLGEEKPPVAARAAAAAMAGAALSHAVLLGALAWVFWDVAGPDSMDLPPYRGDR